MSATRDRAPGEPGPLDSAVGLINGIAISLILWGLLYFLLYLW